MNTTVGSCSICGGHVSVPCSWMGAIPPIPTCESCGATKKRPHGPVIEMETVDQKMAGLGGLTGKMFAKKDNSGNLI